jgi:hypothetical protein
MITELQKVDPQIVGGATISVVDYKIRNYRLHQVLEQVSRLMLFCLENDSNNTSSKAKPSDVRKILSQWKIVKDEFEFSMSHNDFPAGSYEYAFSISLIDQKEIQRVRNVKMKRVISEIFNACRVILSVDSAQTQGFIAKEDADDIRVMLSLVDDVLARWVGAGKDAEDVGLYAPAYEILGEIRPDVDSDWATILEPSKTMPVSKLPDVPDTEV